MDAGYAEAFHLLGQVYERTGRKELARQALDKAGRKNGNLFQVKKPGALRLMTGADKRLAEALREDALTADFTNGH
jgi:cytochrome c-type biogenesis protein CcmH/NrfG